MFVSTMVHSLYVLLHLLLTPLQKQLQDVLLTWFRLQEGHCMNFVFIQYVKTVFIICQTAHF